MTDVHSPEVRSKNMQAIRSGDIRPELLVRMRLYQVGFRYRLHDSALPGKPDIVLPKYRTAVFVHGCFWYRHDCRYFKVPKTRSEFWMSKISANQHVMSAILRSSSHRGGMLWFSGSAPSGPAGSASMRWSPWWPWGWQRTCLVRSPV